MTDNFFTLPAEEHPHYLKNLEQDYMQMINAGMFHESPSTFNEMINGISDLEKMINKSKWRLGVLTFVNERARKGVS